MKFLIYIFTLTMVLPITSEAKTYCGILIQGRFENGPNLVTFYGDGPDLGLKINLEHFITNEIVLPNAARCEVCIDFRSQGVFGDGKPLNRIDLKPGGKCQ